MAPVMGASTKHAQPFVSVAPRIGFVGGLDGIRGVLILLVMLEHSNIGKFRSATGGVDIFYVVSGFLITSLLLQEHRGNGSIDIRKFYSRRAIRLLPSVWLMLLSTIVIVALFARDLLVGLLQEAAAAFFYCYHLFFPVGYDLFHNMTDSKRVYLLVQLWSLSVEEQFYLVVAFAAVLFIGRNWIKQLVVLLVGVIVLATVARWLGHPGPRIILIQRPDVPAIGVLVAIVNAKMDEERAERWRKPLLIVGTIGITIAALTMFAGSVAIWKVVTSVFGIPRIRADGLRTQGWSSFFWPMTYTEAGYPAKPWRSPDQTTVRYWWQFGSTVVAVGVAPAILCMARYKDWFVNRWLSWRPWRVLGRMSYTIYVWHGFYFMVLENAFKNSMPHLQLMAIQFAVGMGVSAAVYYLVEQRILGWKLRYSAEKEVVDLRTGEMVSVASLTGDVPATGSDPPTDPADAPGSDEPSHEPQSEST